MENDIQVYSTYLKLKDSFANGNWIDNHRKVFRNFEKDSYSLIKRVAIKSAMCHDNGKYYTEKDVERLIKEERDNIEAIQKIINVVPLVEEVLKNNNYVVTTHTDVWDFGQISIFGKNRELLLEIKIRFNENAEMLHNNKILNLEDLNTILYDAMFQELLEQSQRPYKEIK